MRPRIAAATAVTALALACAPGRAGPVAPEEHRRTPDQTFLTFPEWFLVHSPAEYAAYLAGEGPVPSPTARIPEIIAVGVGALAAGILGYVIAQHQWGKKFRWRDPSDEGPSQEAIDAAAAVAAARAR